MKVIPSMYEELEDVYLNVGITIRDLMCDISSNLGDKVKVNRLIIIRNSNIYSTL